jgi:hypothetical protein
LASSRFRGISRLCGVLESKYSGSRIRGKEDDVEGKGRWREREQEF